MKTSWASGLYALLLALLLTGCATLPDKPEPPRVSLVGLSLLSMDLFEQRYQVRLRLKNPNGYALPIRGIDFRLEINGQSFADGVSSQSVDVPAYGEQVIALAVTTNLIQVFRQLQSLDGSDSPALAYRLKGAVGVGDAGLRLPFDYAGDLPLLNPSESPAGDGV